MVGAAILTAGFLSACGEGGGSDAAATGGSGGSSNSSGGTTTDGSGAAPGTGGSPSSGGTSSGGSSATGGSPSSGGEGGAGPTSGCEGPVGTTGQQELSLDVDGLTRTYVLSVPQGYDGSTAMPLVFAWHGLGGDGALARLYFGVEQEADGGAIFAYPDGLPIESQGGEPGWDLSADGIDVAFFDQLLAELSAAYCVDGARVFSIGHSYGGYMTNRLGCSRADVLRGVGPVAGGPPFGGGQSPCTGSMAAFMTHGTFDETVEVDQGIAARDGYLERAGCTMTSAAVEPSPCVAYEGCAADTPVVWCEHDTPAENAHGWPDFVATGLWDFLTTLP